MSQFLPIWRRLNRLGSPGRRAFGIGIGLRAPYFATIKPLVVELQPGRCVVRMRKRRRVLNHLGTIQAIAMCNSAELAAGLALDSALPSGCRWIARGMTVEYVAKGTTDLQTLATVTLPSPWRAAAQDVMVAVVITDARDVVVLRADITMYVSPKVSSDLPSPARRRSS